MLLLLGGYLCMEFIPEKEEEKQKEAVTYIEITEFSAEDVVSYSYKNAEYEMGFDITENAEWLTEFYLEQHKTGENKWFD